jgi:hypothetical protein
VSTPESHDPLVVNTQDGCCWLRHAVTRGGKGLYALAGTVAGAPDVVLATLADLAEHGLASMADALPMPVGPSATSYPPAVPWAAHMSHEDLTDFLDELAASAITHASAGVALAEVEATCARWRAVAEARRAYGSASPADGITRRIAPMQALRGEPVVEDVKPQVQQLRSLLAGKRAAVEDPHDGPLSHSYRIPRDLPEMGGRS